MNQSSLLAALPGMAVPISDAEVFFQPDNRADRHVMTPDVYGALQQCAGFASLDTHVARVASSMPRVDRTQLTRVLENLVQRGLLQSASTLLDKPVHRKKPGSLRTLAVLSQAHPAALEACLASLREGDAARGFTLVFADTSETPEHRARKLELVADFGRKTGQRVVILDAKIERWLAERERQHPTQARGLSLLFGKQASRKARALNALSLVCAGERALLIDDTHRFRLFGDADWASAPIHFDQRYSREPKFYGTADEAISASARAGSPWDLAEQWLGAYAIDKLSKISIEGMRFEQLAQLCETRVHRMCLGSVGSADTAHALWIFLADMQARAQFADPAQLELALSGNALVLNYPEIALNSGSHDAAQAVDFTELAGFAMGIGEDADRSFSACSTLLAQGYAELHLPLGLERRSGAQPRAQRNRELLTPSFARFFADQLRDITDMAHAASLNSRANWAAATLLDLAHASNIERQNLAWRYLSAQRAQLLGQLQQILMQAGDAPEPWRHELINVIKEQAEGALQSAVPALADAPLGLKASEHADWLQTQLIDAAHALQVWAELAQDPDARRME